MKNTKAADTFFDAQCARRGIEAFSKEWMSILTDATTIATKAGRKMVTEADMRNAFARRFGA